MRTTPTVIDVTGSFEWQTSLAGNASYAASSITIGGSESSATVLLIAMTTASQTANAWGHLRASNSSTAALGFGAEL